MQLRDRYEEIRALDAEVLAVSTDNLQGARQSVEQNGVAFPILYDVTEEVPRQYGVFDLFGDGLASASVFIIDTQGKLRFSSKGRDYSDHLAVAIVLDELRKL